MDILASITTAIGLGQKAITLTKNLANQEVRQIVYEVTEQLLQVKSDFLELKGENLKLKEENANLKAENQKLSGPPEMVLRDGFYWKQLELDSGNAKPFCAHCYDRGKISRLVDTVGDEKLVIGPRKCPRCETYQ